MEMDQTQPKFARSSPHGNGNGRFVTATTIGHQSGKMDDEEDELGDHKLLQNGVDLGGSGGLARYYGGYPSSRIVRVSRASGGKDRHSKVLTSKGLRDRRVRLSVNTAIQFYDLQDRLGFDQPSKAVEWLLKAAASSIAELPPMNSLFPDTAKQLSDEKWSSTNEQLGLDSAHEVDMDSGGGGGGGGGDVSHIQHHLKRSSASSSPSDTSKGSGLTLSRSESGVKTSREQAKERLAEKDKESSSSIVACLNPMSQTTSFTELLSGGGGGRINRSNNHDNNNTTTNTATNETNFFLKSPRQQQWSSSTPLDYFTSGLIGSPVPSPMFNATTGDHPSSDHFPHFSFTSADHLFPVVNATASGQYNLNFAISSSSVGANSTSPSTSLAGLINRGTLQSNSSSSQLPHLQRFPTTVVDGSSTHQSFFDNGHHQFLPAGFDARLQLCYGDNNGRRAGHKGKGKN